MDNSNVNFNPNPNPIIPVDGQEPRNTESKLSKISPLIKEKVKKLKEKLDIELGLTRKDSFPRKLQKIKTDEKKEPEQKQIEIPSENSEKIDTPQKSLETKKSLDQMDFINFKIFEEVWGPKEEVQKNDKDVSEKDFLEVKAAQKVRVEVKEFDKQQTREIINQSEISNALPNLLLKILKNKENELINQTKNKRQILEKKESFKSKKDTQKGGIELIEKENQIEFIRDLQKNILQQIEEGVDFLKIYKEIINHPDAIISYIDTISAFFNEDPFNKKNSLHIDQIYRFLLNPSEKKFRKDFLFAGHCMDFVIEDQKNQLNQIPRLIKQMETILLSKNNSKTQKRVVLDFAANLIKRGIFKKEVFKDLIAISQDLSPKLKKSVENLEDSMKSLEDLLQKKEELDSLIHLSKSSNKDLQFMMKDPIKELINPLLKTLESSHIKVLTEFEIQYDKKQSEVSLSSLLKKIARNEKTLTSEQKEFIANFAEDIHTLIANALKLIHPTEWLEVGDLTKESAQKNAPNLLYLVNLVNQIESFTAQQFFQIQDAENRQRLCNIFAEICRQLIENNHDYLAIMPFMQAITHPSVMRLIPELPEFIREVDKKISSPIRNFISYRNEISKYSKGDYLPYLSVIMRDIVFIKDGNPNNFEKMKLMVEKINQEIEETQNNLSFKTTLHYNLIDQIVKIKLINDEDRFELSESLLNTKEKIVVVPRLFSKSKIKIKKKN